MIKKMEERKTGKSNKKHDKQKNSKKEKQQKNIFQNYDWNLLYLVLFTCGIGLILIYSASAYIAKSKNLESTYFLKRQLMTIVIGLGCMLLIASKIDYKWLKTRFKLPAPGFIRDRYGKNSMFISFPAILLFLMTVLQAYTTFFAPVTNGARRWISVFGQQLQPSEIAKFVVIIFGAYTCAKISRDEVKPVKLLLDLLCVLPLLIFIAIANLSAAIIVAMIYAAILFTNSKRLAPYILLGVAGYKVMDLYVSLKGGYRSDRFEIWENLESSEKGQQILQGLYAIASGGIFGKGLGESEQKYGRVPEAYNDMIFTIICEEIGIFGGIAILILFGFILYRMWIVIVNARDRFGALLGIGIMSQVGIQVILNVLVVTNTIPSTGVVLPFISFGGSSIVLMMIEIGFFLNISSKIQYTDKLKAKRDEKKHNKAVNKQ